MVLGEIVALYSGVESVPVALFSQDEREVSLALALCVH